MKENIKNNHSLENFFKSLIWILLFSFCLSFCAKLFWFFDLFSHFTFQYAVGGLLLGIIISFYKKWNLALISLIVGITAFAETRLNLENPLQLISPSYIESDTESYPVKLVQYNHNVGKDKF